MKRSIAVLVAGIVLMGVTRAWAQDAQAGPGTLDVTMIPAGGTFFTSSDNGPDFGNYTLGGSVTYNVTRVLGIEGEFAGALGITQDLAAGRLTANEKTPDMLSYSANAVVSLPTQRSLVPYVTGGIGGMTMLEREELGVGDAETFLTGNVGGGVKWYAGNGRWGLRGDYRFAVVDGKEEAPAFFGRETRYGHRFYAGVVIKALR